MANAIVTTRDTQLEKQRLGFMALSLTEFDTTNEPAIAAGSVVEIGGSLFVVTVDEAITGWAGIANDTDAYIKLVPDVSDFAAEFTTDAPTWSASKQGWYDGIDRFVAVIHRGATAADFESKGILLGVQGNTFLSLVVARDMKATRGYIPQHTLYGAAVTEETIFDAMEASIPENGDIIGVWGGVDTAGNLSSVAYAKRHDATQIDFYVIHSNGQITTIPIVEDDSSQRNVALAW